MNQDDIEPVSSFERTVGATKTRLFAISKEDGASTVNVSLLVGKDQIKVPSSIISQIIGDALKEIIFGHLFPKPFIASAERTGAAIFRKELDFARNRLLEEMGAMKQKDINPFQLLEKVHSDYALPVKRNVDFTRSLEEISKEDSFIEKEHGELLLDFSCIIGGGIYGYEE